MTLPRIVYHKPKGSRGIWVLNDFSKGLGPLEYVPGYYYFALLAETRYPGVVGAGYASRADLTGIALNEKPVRSLRIGDDYWLITSTTVYQSVGGTANWVEVGANGVGWTTGNPEDIIAFRSSGANPVIAVAMGSSTAYQFTVDNGANWTASNKTGNAKYANYFAVVTSGLSPRVAYVRNPDELYFTNDLSNSGAGNTATNVGDNLNDHFHSLIEDPAGVLLLAKHRYLYTVDSMGRVSVVAGPFGERATSELGTFTGYPTTIEGHFTNPQVIEGRIYWIVEERRIIEWDWHNGVVRFGIEPKAWGAAGRLNLPIVGMTTMGEELWIALSNDGTLINTGSLPGRNGLLGNQNISETLLFAGRRQPDGSWQWHGALAQDTSGVARYLWRNEIAETFVLGYAAQKAANGSQVRFYVPSVNPLTRGLAAGFSPGTLELETGIYDGGSREMKRFLTGRGRMNITSNGIAAWYRTLSDNETIPYSSGSYTRLDSYETNPSMRYGGGVRFGTGMRYGGSSGREVFETRFPGYYALWRSARLNFRAASGNSRQVLHSYEAEYEEVI